MRTVEGKCQWGNTRTNMEEITPAHLTSTELGTASFHTREVAALVEPVPRSPATIKFHNACISSTLVTFGINTIEFYTLREIFTFDL